VFNCLSKPVLKIFELKNLPKYSKLSTRVCEFDSDAKNIKIKNPAAIKCQHSFMNFTFFNFKKNSLSIMFISCAIIMFMQTINHLTFW